MPPWHVARDVGIQDFKNDISLSDAEISMIAAWVDAGTPEGNPADMPAPRTFPTGDEWALADLLGPPDVIIKSKPFNVPAGGQDQWWNPISEFPDLGEKDGCAHPNSGPRTRWGARWFTTATPIWYPQMVNLDKLLWHTME